MTVKAQPAIVTGLLAGLIVFTSEWFGIPGWVAFLTWTTQNFLEENGIGIVGALCAFAIGLLVATVAAATGQVMPVPAPAIGGPVAIGVACAFVVLLGGFFKTLQAPAAVFIGMIAWFGSHWTGAAATPIALLMASGLGLLAHRLTTYAAVNRVAKC